MLFYNVADTKLFLKGIAVNIEDIVGGEANASGGGEANSLTARLEALEAAVAQTATKSDDALLHAQKLMLMKQFEAFKASKQGFNEADFWAKADEKYQNFVNLGMSPEEAQSTMDKLYLNPIGWEALYNEGGTSSEPIAPDETLDDGAPAGVSSSDALIAKPNKANLGKALMGGNK